MNGPGGKWYNSPVSADREDRQSWIPRSVTTSNRKTKLFFGEEDFVFPVAYRPVQQRAAPHGEADTEEKIHPWRHPSESTKEVPDRVLPDWMSPTPRGDTRDQDSFGGGIPDWMNLDPATSKGTREVPEIVSQSTSTSTRGGKPNWLLPSTNIPKGTHETAVENRPTCKSQSTSSFRGAKEVPEGGTARTISMYPSTTALKDTQVDTGGVRPIRTAPSDSSMRGTKDGVRLDVPFRLPPATTSNGVQEKTGGDKTSLVYPLSATSRGSSNAKRGDRLGSFSPFYTMGGTYDVTGGDRPDWMIPSAVSSSTQHESEGERPGWMLPSTTPKGTHFPRRTNFGGPKKFFPPPQQENVPCPAPSTLVRLRSASPSRELQKGDTKNRRSDKNSKTPAFCCVKKKAPKKSQGVVQHQRQQPTQSPQKAIPSSKPTTTLKTKQHTRKTAAVAGRRPLGKPPPLVPISSQAAPAPLKDSSSTRPKASSSKRGTCAML